MFTATPVWTSTVPLIIALNSKTVLKLLMSASSSKDVYIAPEMVTVIKVN
jgi:hypothetical protein